MRDKTGVSNDVFDLIGPQRMFGKRFWLVPKECLGNEFGWSKDFEFHKYHK